MMALSSGVPKSVAPTAGVGNMPTLPEGMSSVSQEANKLQELMPDPPLLPPLLKLGRWKRLPKIWRPDPEEESLSPSTAATSLMSPGTSQALSSLPQTTSADFGS